MGRGMKRRKVMTWKWVAGNHGSRKRRARGMMQRGCGCFYCCPMDLRRKITDRDDRRIDHNQGEVA